MSVTFSYLSKEKHPSGLEFWYFSLSFTLFENINLEHNLLPDCGQFIYVLICKNVCQASLPSFLLLAIFWLDPYQMEIRYLFNSASLSLVEDNSLAHKLRVMAAVELHLNATYA